VIGGAPALFAGTAGRLDPDHALSPPTIIVARDKFKVKHFGGAAKDFSVLRRLCGD
jgi:hypothetical protein